MTEQKPQIMIICKCGAYVDYERLAEHREVTKCEKQLEYNKNLSIENLITCRTNSLEIKLTGIQNKLNQLADQLEKLFEDNDISSNVVDDTIDLNMLKYPHPRL